jgi:ribosomal protein L29
MSYADLLKKNKADLEKTLAEKREGIRAFRFNVAGSKSTNVKEGRNLRKDVARIMTALRTKDKQGNL